MTTLSLLSPAQRPLRTSVSLPLIIHALAFVLLSAVSAPAQVPGTWLQLPTADFTVFYAAGYSQDAEQARQYLGSGVALMRQQYRLDRLKFPLRVYLFPTVTDVLGGRVSIGGSFFTTLQDENKQTVMAIAHLTPSASVFKTSGTTTSISTPFDENYHHKTLVHEFVHAIQYSLDDQYFIRDPKWTYEGEAEVAGMLASAVMAELGHELTLRKLKPTQMVCCNRAVSGTQAIATASDVYLVGYPYHHYLVARWGYDLFRRLHNPSQTSNYMERLAKETGMSITDLFTGYQTWLKGALESLPPEPPFRVTSPLTLDVEASSGSDRVLIVTATPLSSFTSSAPWLAIESPLSKSGSFYSTRSWTANTSGQPRTASITLKHSTGYTISVTVNQKAQ